MKYFFVGIKGVGVAGIATLYKKWGHEVLGSDTQEIFFTDEVLKRVEIPVVSFSVDHITPDTGCVIYSSAYGVDHPQVLRARELQIPTFSYAEALADLFNQRRGIIVTGTHGKTTCTAMLGRVLEDAEFDPTVVVGGEVEEWHSTVRAGASDWMVAEGDEYQAKILMLKPYAVLLTNIEYDHPDFYPTPESYQEVFAKLLEVVPSEGLIVAHESLQELVQKHGVARKVFFSTADAETMRLRVWGEHNRVNALGVATLAKHLGVSFDAAVKTLKDFRGTKRRMELYTDADASRVVLDDYAHHPTEIRATLAALRERYPDRHITACFQPHTYSRTKALLDDFANAFRDADTVIIADIYSSAREKEKTISGKELSDAVGAHHAHVTFAADLDEVFRRAQENREDNSVFVALGAGDVWRVAERLSKVSE